MNNEKGKIIFENNSELFIERQLNGLPKAPRIVPMPPVKLCKETIKVYNGVYKNNHKELAEIVDTFLNSLMSEGDEIEIIINKRSKST